MIIDESTTTKFVGPRAESEYQVEIYQQEQGEKDRREERTEIVAAEITLIEPTRGVPREEEFGGDTTVVRPPAKGMDTSN